MLKTEGATFNVGDVESLKERIEPRSKSRIKKDIEISPLGLSFEQDRDDDYYMFKKLNFPHMKRTHPASSESSDASISPPPSPIFVNASPAASFLAGFMSPKGQKREEKVDTYRFDTKHPIGVGGFSTVCKGHDTVTDRLVAVKIIQMRYMSTVDRIRLEREYAIWHSLNHINIVHLYKIIHIPEEASYIICEYCSGGHLRDYLTKREGPLLENEARSIFQQICRGIHYLHTVRKVCHKDLKLENILLNSENRVKICDFGLAIDQGSSHVVGEYAGGSLAYTSPEQIRQRSPISCPKTDIWSLGVILYSLVVGALPFTDTFELRLQQKILQGQFEIPCHLSDAVKELIKQCLHPDPMRRYDIIEVLKSSWLINEL
ncbi:kinase-like protein [Backusella circina FSU 941]|nr:kinase-like protein [Backusella circina FSU 941]